MTAREKRNRELLCEYMEQGFKDGRLYETDLDGRDVYILEKENDNDEIKALVLDKKTGDWLFSEAGQDKGNKRAYLACPLPGNKEYMLSNYTFRVVVEGLLGNSDQAERYDKYKNGVVIYRRIEPGEPGYCKGDTMYGPSLDSGQINHINGDTLDNSDSNLEVTTEGLNKAHSRFMAEVHYWFPELIVEEFDCQGKAMHKWVDGVGVTCEQIRAWNQQFLLKRNHPDIIKSFRDKDGWRHRYQVEQVARMLRFFGKEV